MGGKERWLWVWVQIEGRAMHNRERGVGSHEGLSNKLDGERGKEGGREGDREGGHTGFRAIMAETSPLASASTSLPIATLKSEIEGGGEGGREG